MRRLILLGAVSALAACSEPGQQQAQQTQKPSGTAQVAPNFNPAALPATPQVSSAPPLAQLDGDDASVAPAAAAPATVTPAAEAGAPPAPSDIPLVAAINQASAPATGKAAAPAGWTVKGVDPSLIRAEVLLDRAGFSPGVIDGKDGQNLKQAVEAYAKAKGLSSSGLDKAVFDSLAADSAPTAQT